MRTLRELVEWKLPQLASHLAALGCDISMLATDWFLCLFCTTLPAETSTRVWDALFCEGPKVLFRVALALLSAHERALLACREVGELLRTLRRAAASTHDRDALMDVAFSGVGGLPMGAIARRRARNQRGVDGERAARETRASLRAAVSKGFVLSPEAEALAREVPEPPASLHAADIAVEVPRRAVQWMAAVGGRTRDKIQGGARALHQRSKSWTVGL
ncbi:hypothetical protein H632_c2411p0 [Helicosporidium sp. ATCC 50920]|nr:hypothetical protein H632_c2411p0 [Helicosporidium sp. ATCC 50920]|eukprot:KDD73221.1 hypothetical protein H632_c2411p0 [Helicosporidium sp. ATCC 50920]